MSLEKMKEYLDRCIEAYPDSITTLSLTGGECMLLGDDLESIMRYGRDKGLNISMISNGFWGYKYKNAYESLVRLKNAGLTTIAVSTGEDHQCSVPLRSCRNVVVAAARLGFIPILRIESHLGVVKCRSQIENDVPLMRLVNAGRIKLCWQHWEEYSNEKRVGQGYPWKMSPYGTREGCESLFRSVIISPYGDVMACAGIPCSRIPYMRLGNIEKESVKTVYERGFQDALKVWIYKKGAVAVLDYVHQHSDIRFYNPGYNCNSCIEIFRNPKILPFLRKTYWDWRDEIRF